MIIILSPAKTFNRITSPYDTEPVFAKDAKLFIHKLKRLSIKKIMQHMHVSKSLAQTTRQDYQSFGLIQSAAIHAYYGHQFRHFDVASLEARGLKKNIKNVYMLSGLYGLVNAYDGISFYRFEMKDKTLTNLYTYWQDKLWHYMTTTFKNDVIYNLASEEYGQLIKGMDHVITIQFFMEKNNHLSMHAMEAKRMRGLFARYLVMYTHIDLKGIKLEGYTYSIKHSTPSLYTYIKEIV